MLEKLVISSFLKRAFGPNSFWAAHTNDCYWIVFGLCSERFWIGFGQFLDCFQIVFCSLQGKVFKGRARDAFGRLRDLFSHPKGRTEVIIRVSEAKLHIEVVSDIQKCLEPPKPGKICKKRYFSWPKISTIFDFQLISIQNTSPWGLPGPLQAPLGLPGPPGTLRAPGGVFSTPVATVYGPFRKGVDKSRFGAFLVNKLPKHIEIFGVRPIWRDLRRNPASAGLNDVQNSWMATQLVTKSCDLESLGVPGPASTP